MKCESCSFYVSNFIFKGSQKNKCDNSENVFGNRYDLRDLKILDVIPGKLFCKVIWYSNGIKRE